MLENQEILKEEINKLNQQISLLGQLRPKLTSLEIENARLVAERKQWTGFLDGDQDPYTITKSLAKLKIENKSLLESIQQLQDKCRELTVNSKSYSSTIDDLNKKINNQILEIEQSNHEKNRISKSRALSIREIELLKNQLSLYNLEDSMSDVKLDEIKSVYISELQNLLQEYKSTVLNLEDEIKNKVVESIVIEKQIVDHGKEDTGLLN